MLLAVVAGFVDAVVFWQWSPCSRPTSGNDVFLGLSIGGANPARVGPAGRNRGVRGRCGGRPMVDVAGRPARRCGDAARTGVGATDALAVVLVVSGENEPFTQPPRRSRRWPPPCSRWALQTDMIRTVAGVAVSTTYLTGAIRRHWRDHRYAARRSRARVGTTAGRRLVGGADRLLRRGRARREPTRSRPDWPSRRSCAGSRAVRRRLGATVVVKKRQPHAEPPRIRTQAEAVWPCGTSITSPLAQRGSGSECRSPVERIVSPVAPPGAPPARRTARRPRSA